MKKFERALELLRDGDDPFLNRLYWLNTCSTCHSQKNVNCGRGWRILHMMGQLTFSVPVELEVPNAG